MKALRIIGLLLVAPLTTVTQAVTFPVLFSNLGAGINAPVFDTDQVTPLAGGDFRAELVYDAVPIGGAADTVAGAFSPFVSGGYFSPTVRTISGFDQGDPVTFWVRAWDARSGSTFATASIRGTSDAFFIEVPAEFPPPQPQSLRGLNSFALVPEPAVIVPASMLLVFAWLRARQSPR